MDRLARRFSVPPWQVDWDSPEVCAWLLRAGAVDEFDAASERRP
jgi:hypothetical protein